MPISQRVVVDALILTSNAPRMGGCDAASATPVVLEAHTARCGSCRLPTSAATTSRSRSPTAPATSRSAPVHVLVVEIAGGGVTHSGSRLSIPRSLLLVPSWWLLGALARQQPDSNSEPALHADGLRDTSTLPRWGRTVRRPTTARERLSTQRPPDAGISQGRPNSSIAVSTLRAATATAARQPPRGTIRHDSWSSARGKCPHVALKADRRAERWELPHHVSLRSA
jgi:hypothetical protein